MSESGESQRAQDAHALGSGSVSRSSSLAISVNIQAKDNQQNSPRAIAGNQALRKPMSLRKRCTQDSKRELRFAGKQETLCGWTFTILLT
jgi:hypothetical protein